MTYLNCYRHDATIGLRVLPEDPAVLARRTYRDLPVMGSAVRVAGTGNVHQHGA